MRSSIEWAFVAALSALALPACGAASDATPAASPTATTTTTASASAPATSLAPAPSATSTASAAAPDPPTGPRRPELRFWSFDGPADGPAITAKRAWTAIATGAANDPSRRVFVSVETFVKTDAGQNHFRSPLGDIVSPVAMGAPLTPPATLKVGDAVFADDANDSALGRVIASTADTVTLTYVFGDLAGELEAPRAEVVLLDGALRLGVPVTFTLASRTMVGRLLAKSPTDAWIALDFPSPDPFVKVPASTVRALDTRPLKVGDACLADSSYVTKNELVPCKITKVIESGVFYEVKTDKGATWRVPFHHVSPKI